MPITKEYEYDLSGNKVLKKVTISKGKYDKLDLFLRIIGSSAVIVTIIGLSCNINAQRKQQQTLFQLEVYKSALPVINKLCYLSPSDSSYIAARNQLLNEIIPKIQLTDNKGVIDVINQFDTIRILKEHCSGLTDSFELASRTFFVFARNNGSFITKKDSLSLELFNHYRLFFNNKKRYWENYNHIYSRAMNIVFPDSAEKKVQEIHAFYQTLHTIFIDYLDLYSYNQNGTTPLDGEYLPISIEQYKVILERKNLLKPANLISAFMPKYRQINNIDSSISDRMNGFQRKLIKEMTKSNK